MECKHPSFDYEERFNDLVCSECGETETWCELQKVRKEMAKLKTQLKASVSTEYHDQIVAEAMKRCAIAEARLEVANNLLAQIRDRASYYTGHISDQWLLDMTTPQQEREANE